MLYVLQVYITSSPILTSFHCAQEKLNWIRRHLGESWLDKLVLANDVARIDLYLCLMPFLFSF